MENNLKIIEAINQIAKKQLWLDFEIMQYVGKCITLMASIDTSDKHDLEIDFNEVFLIKGPVSWTMDSEKPAVEIVKGDEMIQINRQYQIEQGFTLFKLNIEDSNSCCYFSAKSISYRILNNNQLNN